MNKRIYLWTGNGWGKTTSALGAALRALGHGYRVVFIQFMKGRKDIGEYKIKNKLGKKFELYQFGRKGWVDLKKPSKKDKQLAQKALGFAKKKAKEKPFLLVLDEINVAVKVKLLKEKEVIDFLNEIPAPVNVYLTGRWATDKLKRRANWVNIIVPTKGPKKMKGEKGIDY